jgi:hypothetical protein
MYSAIARESGQSSKHMRALEENDVRSWLNTPSQAYWIARFRGR